LPYDPVRDFAPVTLVWNYPSLLAVAANSPAKTVADLIAIARRAPNTLSYASQGFGTAGHLGGALLAAAAGTSMVHVPYKGAPEVMNDLVSGRVDIFIASYASLGPFYKSGKVRLLAAASAKRHYLVPDLPTLAELGYPDIRFDGWFGVVAPAKTPQPVVQRLHDELVRAVTAPDVSGKMSEQGIVTMTSASPAEFAAFIESEVVRLGRAVKLSGAKVE
jgi:tripartite-type tricarboxylate transporter receptor subunit TctC